MNGQTSKNPAKNKKSKQERASSKLPATPELETEIEKLRTELHDRIGQSVTAIKFLVDIMANSPEKDLLLLNEIRTLVHQTQVDVRHLYDGIQSISNKIKNPPDNSKILVE